MKQQMRQNKRHNHTINISTSHTSSNTVNKNYRVFIFQWGHFIMNTMMFQMMRDDPFFVKIKCSDPRTPNEDKFSRMFYSTKRLLKYANKSENMQADEATAAATTTTTTQSTTRRTAPAE